MAANKPEENVQWAGFQNTQTIQRPGSSGSAGGSVRPSTACLITPLAGLLLACLAALVALGSVNRFEQCRDLVFAQGCVWQDAGGVVEIANLEAISIMTAAFLYVLEGGKRRQWEMLDAHNVIITCLQAGLRDAPARNDAPERFSRAGLEFACRAGPLGGRRYHSLVTPIDLET